MKYLYIANWKMNMTYAQSIDFCVQNNEQLKELSSNANIILCPSFLAIAPIAEILKDTNIKIGAQNCSEYEAGSYTGEVSAQSLFEAGARYCIIGHSERRLYFGETTETIIKKMRLLFLNNITPIICIGERKEDFLQQKTNSALAEQLESILIAIRQHKYQHIIIGYEPFWAVGSGIIPEAAYLQEIFAWLKDYVAQNAPHCSAQFVYGGSIAQNNILELKNIPHIDGFLIGGASLHVEDFIQIISQ